MTTIEEEKNIQGSNSKYTYLNNNNLNEPGKDHPKLRHFYNYESVKMSPKKNILSSTMNVSYNFSNHNQHRQKIQGNNMKDQLFDSRLSFQRHSPSYNKNLLQQDRSNKNKQKSRAYNYNVEFSPFEDNQMIQKLFVQELQTQYHLVKNQLKEYQYQNQLLREKVKNLENCNQINFKSIQLKSQEIAHIKKQNSIQVQKYEGLVDQLRKQIQILMTKNIGVESEVQFYRSQMAHLTNQLIYKDLTKQRFQKYNRMTRQPGVLYLRRQSIEMFKRKRSMPGRLLNKTYTNIGDCQNTKANQGQKQNVQKSEQQIFNFNSKRLLKYEHFIQSIKCMFKKIQKSANINLEEYSNKEVDLKVLWKWLKKLGHYYSNYCNQLDN